jgi:threonine/homoserine/homoserine lactone efflux protein
VIETAAILAWTALAAAVAVTPGPDTVLVASHAARGGVRAGLFAVAGTTTGGVWYALLFGFGLLAVLVAIPALFVAVKVVGALYLAWLGIGMIAAAIRGKRSSESKSKGAVVLGSPFLQGFLTNVLNPKVAVFYLAALPQFVPATSDGALIGALLILIHYVLGGIWLSLIAVLSQKAREVSWNPKFLRWFEGLIGTFFVGVAGRLALTAR